MGLIAVLFFGSNLFARGLAPVPLPYSFHDAQGVQWDIMPDGTIGPGNADVFEFWARLIIGGGFQYSGASPQCQFDAARNEIVLSSQTLAELSVSRRISIDEKTGWLRYAEVLENPTARAIKVPVHVAFQTGQPIESSQPIGDPKQAGKSIGLAISDMQRGIAFLTGGRGAKISAATTAQAGMNMVDIAYENVEVPAHQTVVIVHAEAVRGSRNDAEALLQRDDDRQILSSLPPELVKRVVNFRDRGGTYLDRDLLRGDLLDIVELRTGDQYKGTLREPKYQLKTAYGAIELPAERVISMFAIGDYRPYALIVTSDGQAFAGELSSPAIRMELSSGQMTPIPFASIARLGYRHRAGDPEEPKLDGPALMLRAGDRLRITPPAQSIAVATRYGRIELNPQTIASVALQADEQPVHQITLNDGSTFAGLADATSLNFNLRELSSAGAIAFPAATVSRLQLAPPRAVDEQTPQLVLSTSERLVGTLSGTMTLDTAFDAVQINGAEVRAVAHHANTPAEVEITMWDGATLGGRLHADEVNIALMCGLQLRVPAGLIDHYANPAPICSPAVLKELQNLVGQMSADDESSGKAIERITALGPNIVGGLKSLRQSQSPAARERIDRILGGFDVANKPVNPPSTAPQDGVEMIDRRQQVQPVDRDQ